MRGYPTEDTPSERARDPGQARRLWSVSEELTGVSYDLSARIAADARNRAAVGHSSSSRDRSSAASTRYLNAGFPSTNT